MGRLEPVIGTEIVDDIRLGHSWYEFDVLSNFVMRRKPKYFVEIGVHEGGLSYLLMPMVRAFHAHYIGVELFCGLIRPTVLRMYQDSFPNTSELICKDCFDVELFNRLKGIQDKIIYCDGGHKAQELQHFKDACLSGDFLMAHDYHDGVRQVKNVPREYFTPEVVPSDIASIDADETFQRLDEEIFKETRIVGWMKK